MADSYREALAYLYGLEPRGIRLELDRVEAALTRRGDPHRGLRFVHVAGTNGKGSVSAMLERALRAAGLRTGLFTSPHLHRFVERIRVDGEPIDEEEVARRVASLRAETGMPELTFFESTTILAFEAFRDAAVDVVVLEVGLGGRLDATNVITPLVSVITNVGLEHQGFLGDTIELIAGEKAGVIKAAVPVVTGSRDPRVLGVIEARASALGAPLARIDEDFRLEHTDGGFRFSAGGARIEGLRLGLEGASQRQNAAVAAAALLKLREAGLEVPDAAIATGLADVRWPGRLERLDGAPRVLLDAAHNPDGCRALAEALRAAPRVTPTVLLFGALEDKDHEAMLGAFDGLVDARVYALPRIKRAPDAGIFVAVRPGEVAASVEEGLALARERATPEGLVVICGSIFLLSAARAILLDLPEDPKIAM